MNKPFIPMNIIINSIQLCSQALSMDIDKEDIMAESLQDYITTYSFNRLEETARTFRRLGEAYEDAYVDTLDTVNVVIL